MASESKIQGWETYPQNLSNVDFDSHEYNFKAYCKQLKSDSPRLFVSATDDINIKAIQVKSRVTETMIEDRVALDQYLQDLDTDSGLNLILVPQQGSWGHLVFDEPSARKTLTRLHAFPPIIDVIRAFGERTGYEDDSAGGIYLRSCTSGSLHETTYLVKQVEEHGRSDSVEPWSIRQMAVYHRAGPDSGNTFLIINPSKPLLGRLECMQAHPERFSPKALHYMVLSCSMENWRWYISALEKRYVKLKKKAQLVKLSGNGIPTSPSNIGIEDAQEIQFLQDKCQQLAQALNLDCEVLRLLPSHLCKLTNSQVLYDPMQSLLSEGTLHANRVEMLLKRLDGTIALTRTVLDFSCLASLQYNSRMMTHMAFSAKTETTLMRELTEKTTRDADAVKWLTFLTLIYLPASFVATMMGMGYINVQKTDRLSIQVTGEFWIFLVLTGVFLFSTMALYFYFIRRTWLRGQRESDCQLAHLRNDKND